MKTLKTITYQQYITKSQITYPRIFAHYGQPKSSKPPKDMLSEKLEQLRTK